MTIYTKPPRTGELFFHIRRGSWDTLHAHDDYWEFLLVLDGKIVHVINGEKVELPKHSLCLIRPNDVHALKNDGFGPSLHLNLGVSVSQLQTMLSLISPTLYNELLEAPLPIVVTLPPSRTQRLERDAYKTLAAEKNRFDQRLNILFLDVLREFYALLSSSATKKNYSHPVTELLALFARYENMRIPLRELINQTGYSYPHMNRIFTKEVGRSPSDFFRNKRFEYAKTLIADTDIPLQEIAFLIGYESYPHFSTAFKRYAGIAPGEYARGESGYYTKK